jgi:hypothetical protein
LPSRTEARVPLVFCQVAPSHPAANQFLPKLDDLVASLEKR